MKVNNNFKKIAIKAAREAGIILMENFGRTDKFFLKKDKTIVSDVDSSAEKKIISLVKDNFPSHDVFGEEEGGQVTNKYSWVIDALDGTTNYIIGVPVFSVSIALLYNKEPILGVIYNPILKKLYFSEKGQGFFINGKRVIIKEKACNPDSVLMLGKGSGKANFLKMVDVLKKSIGRCRTFRILGSSALDLCHVASSKAEAFILPGADFWDIAAGVLMVKEAGGVVVDFKGKEWNFNSKDLIAFTDRKKRDLFLDLVK